jgi:F-type H+-transporting ATPase subunit gamma
MASLKDIRKRIVSVENTQKITKAMKMVAAARLRRAQTDALEARSYAEDMDELIYRISTSVGVDAPELMRRRPNLKELDLIVIASDRGLCGGFNENLINSVEDVVNMHARHDVEVKLFIYGKKGVEACLKRKIKVEFAAGLGSVDEWEVLIRGMSESLVDKFMSKQSGGSFIAYNYFRSTSAQEVVYHDLLPFHHRRKERKYQVEYLYEPSRSEVLHELVHQAIIAILMQAFRESRASELAARMMAMDASTKNADEMIEYLTMQYHRARQAAITRELMDIVNGAEALRVSG